MKKLISILMLLMAFTMSSNAMSYEQARQQALFLTDKMAYELNLTNDQYEAMFCLTGSIVHSVMQPTSIARSTSTLATGTSAFTHAIRIATTSTSIVLPYT